MKINKRDIFLFRLFSLVFILSLSAAVLLPDKGAGGDISEDGGFVLLLEEVDAALAPCLHVGDRMLDRQTRTILGDITSIRAEPSTTEIFSETKGALVDAAVPGFLRMHISVRSKQQKGAVLTDAGDPVRLGQTYYFRTYDFSGEGRVIALL